MRSRTSPAIALAAPILIISGRYLGARISL